MPPAFSSRSPSGSRRALPSHTLCPAVLARWISRHVAAALLLFATVQLWAVSAAVAQGGSTLLAFTALAVTMGAALPAARLIDRRWSRAARSASAPDSAASLTLLRRYRRDVRAIWAVALLLPLMWVGTVSGIAEAAARVIAS